MLRFTLRRPEVGAATKYLKPLRATPLLWLVHQPKLKVAATMVAATTTSATFSKSRNRYALLRCRYECPHPIKDSEREEVAGRRDSRPLPN